MPSILSIDPHVSTDMYAVALIKNSGKVVFAIEHLTTREVYSFLDKRVISTVIVEGQFVGVNAKNALDLAASRGGITALCELKGIGSYTINPKKWQAWLHTEENKAAERVIADIICSDSKHLFACIGMFLSFFEMTINQFKEANGA